MKNYKKSILLVILLLLIAVSAVFYIRSRNVKQEDIGGSKVSGYVVEDGVQPGLTEEQIRELLQKEVDESMVSYSISSEPIFKGKKAFILMANPRYNACDLEFVIKVDGKEIIRTARISPNQYIEEVELREALPKGKYVGEAYITGYAKESDDVVSNSIVDLNITVQ